MTDVPEVNAGKTVPHDDVCRYYGLSQLPPGLRYSLPVYSCSYPDALCKTKAEHVRKRRINPHDEPRSQTDHVNKKLPCRNSRNEEYDQKHPMNLTTPTTIIFLTGFIALQQRDTGEAAARPCLHNYQISVPCSFIQVNDKEVLA